LLSPINIFSISALTDTENYQSVWHQSHNDLADKENNVSFEGLYKHYR
jgi:hypothetical protein